jgi:biopolymer transport protein ExbD
MKKSIMILLFLVFVYQIGAEGPPIEPDGALNVEHIALKLNKEQLALIGSSRVFKLEKEQLALLRKINPAFPEAIRVLTPSFQDCSCSLSTYGVWNKRDQVCIAIKQIMRDKSDADKDVLKPKTADLTKSSAYVYVNDKGEMYLNQKLITQNELNEIIKKLVSDKDISKMVYLNLPPRVDKETNEKIIKMFSELEKVGKKFEVAIYEDG